MKKIIRITFLCTLSSFFSFAQTPPPTPKSPEKDDDVVKISTSLIQIDAIVTDNNGKIVVNLKPEDFEVFENDEKQIITNFSFVGSAHDITPTPKSNKNEAGVPFQPVQIRVDQVRRTIALVVDDLGLSADSIYTVKRALKKFVAEQMQPEDLVAIILTGKGVGSLQQFTSDKNLLYAAIEKIRWNPIGRAGVGGFNPIEPTLQEQVQLTGATPMTDTTEISAAQVQDEKEPNDCL